MSNIDDEKNDQKNQKSGAESKVNPTLQKKAAGKNEALEPASSSARVVDFKEEKAQKSPKKQQFMDVAAEKADSRAPLPSSQFASVRSIIVIGLSVIGLGFFGAGLWMSLAPLAEGVVAPGQIVVDTNRKTIQHLEGGIVDEILVRDGDKVERGDVLITLDNKQIRARLNAIEVRYFSELAKLARLKAEVGGEENITYPEFLLSRSGELRVQEMIDTQEVAFKSRRDALEGRRSILTAKINELEERIAGLEAERETTIAVQSVIEQELTDAENLLEKGLIEKPRVLDLRRRLTEVKGADARIGSSIASSRININESELEIVQLETNLRQDASREFRETSSSIFELEEELASAQDIRDRIEIRAPRSGVIVGLSVHTQGGVIPPGSPILDIVPESDRLIIEAQIRPTDIDNISPGMEVRVQLTAFQSRSTPMLSGILERVTADTLRDTENNASYYLARVGVSEEELARLDEGLFLVPGMPAEILIQAGERTVLEYLIAPVKSVLTRGFKES